MEETLYWAHGLPPDVLGLVAKAGGADRMKAMRGVCKDWQIGYELGVTGLAILELEHPVLPPGGAAALRFPGLTKINLGSSAVAPAWLDNLRAFPKLARLTLRGCESFEYNSDGRSISSADMESLAALTQKISDVDLEPLRGTQLTLLDLSYCELVTDSGLDALRGMPLTRSECNMCLSCH